MRQGGEYPITQADMRILEERGRMATETELAAGVLKLINEQRYLNGMVQRGRGSDIDADCPTNNIFQYVKEIEQRIAELEAKSSRYEHMMMDYNVMIANRDREIAALLEQAEMHEMWRDSATVTIESLRKQLEQITEVKNDYADDNTRLYKENGEIQEQLARMKEVVDDAPELNMGNYDDDQVRHLNNAMIQLSSIITPQEPKG